MGIDEELHLTKKDFKIEWYSGQGAGGQHRNKHQNCCRITHLATGLRAQGTDARERVTNQRIAFNNLAKLVLSHFYADDPKIRIKARETIRNYHGVRNEVHDKASGLKRTYKEVVTDGKIGEMIEARLKASLTLTTNTDKS
jgi:protein subunit release factor B